MKLNKIQLSNHSLVPSFQELFNDLIDLIHPLSKNNLLIVVGQAGWGKSVTVKNFFKNEIKAGNVGIICVGHHYSNTKFYEMLYNLKDKKYLIIDDLHYPLRDLKTINMIKGCCWSEHPNGKRIISWDSPNLKKLINAPNKFEFNPKVIIIANEIGNNIILKSLKDRGSLTEINLDYNDKVQRIKEIMQIDKLKPIDDRLYDTVVWNYCQKYFSPATKDFTLRSLERISGLRQTCCDWKIKANRYLSVDTDLELVYRLIQKYDLLKEKGKITDGSVSRACKEFTCFTGKSQGTFYNKLKKVKSKSKELTEKIDDIKRNNIILDNLNLGFGKKNQKPK